MFSPSSAAPACNRPPLLLADHPALDFLNSRAFLGGAEVDWLGDGDALLRWLGATGLLPPGLPEARADAERRTLDAVAAEARALREWLRGFVSEHAGELLTPDALPRLAPLNALLAEDAAYRQIEQGDGVLAWGAARRHDLRAALLQPLAAASGDLVCAAEFRRVRHCEGLGCILWFLDLTKAGTRRWCSMALCGNRAKASAHRSRKRIGRGQPRPQAVKNHA